MVQSDVCPTEDAVQAFLKHLVDPLLPEKASVRDNPAMDQQQLIAKQVHSVVLLYNYYHRKQHPELEYLPFNEFCKLAVVLRPALLGYMHFMQKLNEEELIDVEKQLSFTEKMIMDACDISKCLDASKNVPNIEGWPILKVAILLIDCKKEYCFLMHGSITRGVWSVVETSIDTSSQSYDITPETPNRCKRKRVIRKPAKDELKVDESGLLQAGYSAVKEATGIVNSDIRLLESCTVYSQSKEKAASRFYIMQCSQSINEDVIQFPLKGVIESLQGPLVKKSSSSWTITPVVDYFQMLPYSEILSTWISREAFSNSLQDSRITENNIMVDSPQVTVSCVESIMMLINEDGINNIASSSKLCANMPNTLHEKDKIHACTQSADHNTDIQKPQVLQDSKERLLRTALSALIRKRSELALQQRKIEDEIAICDKKIERLVTDGEDEFELKIDSIIEGCNDIWAKNQERMCGQQSFPLKREILSEAVFTMHSPCQKLVGICHEKNWGMPTYDLTQSNGGFLANVTVKGDGFQCSLGGNVCCNSLEARESAAAQMLTIVTSMGKSAK